MCHQVVLLPSAFACARTHARTPVLRAQESCLLYSAELMRSLIGFVGFQLVHFLLLFSLLRFSSLSGLGLCVCWGGVSHVRLYFGGQSGWGRIYPQIWGFILGFPCFQLPPLNCSWSASPRFFLWRPHARKAFAFCHRSLPWAGKHVWSQEQQAGAGAHPWAPWALLRAPGPPWLPGIWAVFVYIQSQSLSILSLLVSTISPFNLQPLGRMLCWHGKAAVLSSPGWGSGLPGRKVTNTHGLYQCRCRFESNFFSSSVLPLVFF